MFEITSDFVWQKIQPRPRDAHKGTFGSVLVVAGSASYRGAAALAVEGALRTGAGIVTLASVEPVLAAVAARLPECCLCPCEAGAEGGISPQNIEHIRRQKASVLLVGPGLGYTAQSTARAAETRALVKTLLPGFSGSAVLDADGLNAAADLLQTEKMPHPQGELILTPHPGEMARLTGRSAAEINADREGMALRYAKAWNAVVVLKGAHTVIAGPDGRCAVNPTGNPGLSRGGSGDVLAGMTSALLACGLPAFEAAACAVYLHGAAADRAAALHGETGMLPHDLLDGPCLPKTGAEQGDDPIKKETLPFLWICVILELSKTQRSAGKEAFLLWFLHWKKSLPRVTASSFLAARGSPPKAASPISAAWTACTTRSTITRPRPS